MAGFKDLEGIKAIKIELTDTVHQPALDVVIGDVSANATSIKALADNSGGSSEEVVLSRGNETTLPIRLNKLDTTISNIVYQAYMYNIVADGVTNDAPSIQALVNLVPDGSTIQFPNSSINLGSDISFGSKTINIRVSPNTEFIGMGMMPQFINWQHRMTGNSFQLKPSNGQKGANTFGESALTCECLPTSTFKGNAVGIMGTVSSPADAMSACIWAGNFLTHIEANFVERAWGIEVDLDVHENAGASTGVDVTGIGEFNPTTGLFIRRADTSEWMTGLSISNAIQGATIVSDHGVNIVSDTALIELKCTRTDNNGKNNSVISLKDYNNVLDFEVRGNGDTTVNVLTSIGGIKYPKIGTYTAFNQGSVYNETSTVISSLATGRAMTIDFTVTGVATGNTVQTTLLSAIPGGLICQCQVVSANTIRCTFVNMGTVIITNLTVKVATLSSIYVYA